MENIFKKLEELDILIREADFSKMTREEQMAIATFISSLKKDIEDAQVAIAEIEIQEAMRS